jgi:hypothetical protein
VTERTISIVVSNKTDFGHAREFVPAVTAQAFPRGSSGTRSRSAAMRPVLLRGGATGSRLNANAEPALLERNASSA